jgi:hypothetical protein
VFIPIVYLYFPETAKLSLEEISAQFGDDVAVHLTDASEAQRKELDDFLAKIDVVHIDAVRSDHVAAVNITPEEKQV